MNRHGGSSRLTLSEILGVNFIVAAKIIHINQKGCHIHDIGQRTIHAFKNILYIFNDCSSLYLNIQFNARGSEFDQVCQFADDLRRSVIGNTVTYVVNRNINYTNICTYRCGFCAFSKG